MTDLVLSHISLNSPSDFKGKVVIDIFFEGEVGVLKKK